MPPPPRPSSPRKEAHRSSTPAGGVNRNNSSSSLSNRSSLPSRPPRRPISQQVRSQTPTKEMTATTPVSPTAGVRVTMGGVSPPTETPMIARPAPPNRTRSKRISVTPSTSNGTPTPRATPSPRPALSATLPKDELDTPQPSPAVEPPAPEYSGTIEDRTEEELENASRTAMQDALRREWADREKVSALLHVSMDRWVPCVPCGDCDGFSACLSQPTWTRAYAKPQCSLLSHDPLSVITD